MRRLQHHKGRKRPRGWHRGVAQGLVDAEALARFERAERRSERLEREVAAGLALHRDEVALWGALEHVAPFVPAWW